ncbi:ROK family protein [Rhodovibrionaceae bacterium A322]
MAKNGRIGLDLGGTKIAGVLLDPSGQPLAQKRLESPRGDYQATLDALVSVVEDLEAQSGRRASVGVGIPGCLSPATGLVKNANSTWLIGHAMNQDLSDLLKRPVRMENDANCFALSEATDGAAAGLPVVFGVILGTGVGAGLVVNQRVLGGLDAVAGEWGHNPLPRMTEDEQPGPDCYCGRKGCIETFVSGPALARDAKLERGHAVSELAEAGDPAARAALSRHVERLARAMAGVINLLDPHAIVLGGGLSKMPHLYRELPKQLEPHIFSDRLVTPILPPKFGDASGVRGAAWLWSKEDLEQGLG